MKRRQAIKNLKRVYEKDLDMIIYMIEESKDDYDSLYELRIDVYNEMHYMQKYYKDFFFNNFLNYFDHQTGKLFFKEANPKLPLEKVFHKINYKTTEFLLRDYQELKKLIKKEEEKQDKKLDDYFRNYKY